MRLRRVVRKLFGLRKSDRSELSTPAIHRAILRAIDISQAARLAPWECRAKGGLG